MLGPGGELLQLGAELSTPGVEGVAALCRVGAPLAQTQRFRPLLGQLRLGRPDLLMAGVAPPIGWGLGAARRPRDRTGPALDEPPRALGRADAPPTSRPASA